MTDTAYFAKLRRAYNLDKPWTGGPDVLYHLKTALDEIDRLRAVIARHEASSYCTEGFDD